MGGRGDAKDGGGSGGEHTSNRHTLADERTLAAHAVFGGGGRSLPRLARGAALRDEVPASRRQYLRRRKYLRRGELISTHLMSNSSSEHTIC